MTESNQHPFEQMAQYHDGIKRIVQEVERHCGCHKRTGECLMVGGSLCSFAIHRDWGAGNYYEHCMVSELARLLDIKVTELSQVPTTKTYKKSTKLVVVPTEENSVCDLAVIRITGNGGHWIMCKKKVGSCEYLCDHGKCPKQNKGEE